MGLLMDLQISQHDTSEKAEGFRANASKACAKCIGHCCLAFTMQSKKSEMLGKVRKAKQEAMRLMRNQQVHNTIMAFHVGALPDAPDPFEPLIDAQVQDIYDGQFWSRNLKPLRVVPVVRRSLQQQGLTSYGCLKFDWRQNRCMAYDTRPGTCRQYICGSAAFDAKPPVASLMQAQPKYYPELAVMLPQMRNKPRKSSRPRKVAEDTKKDPIYVDVDRSNQDAGISLATQTAA